MPDIGLLQGGSLRSRGVPQLVAATPEVFEPTIAMREVAAPFRAPVGGAISVATAVVSAPLVEGFEREASVPGPSVVEPSVVEPSVVEAIPAVEAPAAAIETPEVAAVSEVVAASLTPEPPSVPPVAVAESSASIAPADTRPSRGQGAPAIPTLPASPPPIRASDLFWLALALLVLVATGLGMRDPWPADEPRFAVLARDMALSHEWLFPRVGGDLYQDKPPLFFWLLAICYTLTGSVKASFLVPSFLAAAGTVFLLYDFGRRAVSREAGLAVALISLCTFQFLSVMRGAQIDATLCFLTTFSLYSLLRHLLLGPAWRWYCIGGFIAGVGVFTKGVGFLPVLVLIPFFALRALGWKGLAVIDGGSGGWRWWLAPLAMLIAISLWFVPMLLTVAASGSPEYAAYRDEILFKQTVGRYAAAWHHVKGWYYFIVEVIPVLWLPWSLLLVWLAPHFKAAYHERNARIWLPLFWALIVLVFFSASPGKRGIYILPALPALAIAALPFIEGILARAGVRRAGFVLAGAFLLAAVVMSIGYLANAKFAVDAITAGNLAGGTAFYVYIALCAAGLVYAAMRAPLAAWPVALASLAIVFSYLIAPAMNGERSGKDFTRAMLAQVKPDEQLALVAYKEQFLLYLDRPTINFGHRRWLEGAQESYDAALWLNSAPHRVLLVPTSTLKAYPCFFVSVTPAGVSSDEEWHLVRAPAERACAAQGDSTRAISYAPATR